jgi:hypothetical protein
LTFINDLGKVSTVTGKDDFELARYGHEATVTAASWMNADASLGRAREPTQLTTMIKLFNSLFFYIRNTKRLDWATIEH